jgi:arsenate reductase
MAEGLLRWLSQSAVEAHSAGTHPSRVNPLAIEAMKEVGIDISGHRSKSIEEFTGQSFDVVITVCDNAKESCPVFPGAPERLHWSYEDPAAVEGSREDRLRAFRRVRDNLRERLQSLLISHLGA